MPLKKSKVFQEKKDSKTEFQLKIQSYINSSYSLIVPVKDDTVIFIKDPVNGDNIKLKVNTQEYYEFLERLIGYGLEQKLDKDFAWAGQFGNRYNESWVQYKNNKTKQGE
ncbi:MAG: hypothetical protein O3A49_04520 [Candidatus Marinimicrobia bacterium]|nr:hypothetical protein [Candidatus Neomarinimicrobiota bacterium]